MDDYQAEMKRLNAELKSVTEERDIKKNRPTRSPVALMNRNSRRVHSCMQDGGRKLRGDLTP